MRLFDSFFASSFETDFWNVLHFLKHFIVAAELAKDSSAPGQSQVILDFLLFLMSRNPVTFTSNMSSDSEQKNLLDFQICKGLEFKQLVAFIDFWQFH